MAEIINARLDKRLFVQLIDQMKAKSIKSKKPKGKTLISTGALMKGIHYTVDEDGTTVMTSNDPRI